MNEEQLKAVQQMLEEALKETDTERKRILLQAITYIMRFRTYE